MTSDIAGQSATAQALTVAQLIRDLGGLPIIGESEGVTRLSVDEVRIAEVLRQLLGRPGARFADAFATAGSPAVLRIVVALDLDATYLVLETGVSGDTLPWLSDVTPAAFVEECEMFEQFGLQPPEGHLLNRLVVAPVTSPDHPRLTGHETPTRDTHLPFAVTGSAFEFPVGPVRGAGVESLYYGLVTSGEEVVDAYLHTWHKYRGIEARLAGQTPREALFLVERGDGLSAVSTAVAFASAAEAATGMAVPDAVMRTRAICLELERLYNHAQCAAALAQSTGLSIGQAQAEISIEDLLRANAAVAGHRYLFGVVDIGDGRDIDMAALRRLLPPAVDELRGVLDALLETNSFMDRVEACGILTGQASADLGLVGPIARGCGTPLDVRVDHPQFGAPLPGVRAAVKSGGDCLARLRVRREEVDESARLIGLLARGESDLMVPQREPCGWGVGAAESPRGETLAWVQLGLNGRITRARLRTGSARNWRAFDDALRSQNVFTDVAIIEASFWLTTAGRVL